MSRIRAIEARVHRNEALQGHRLGYNDLNKKINDYDSRNSKDEEESNQITDLLHKLPKLAKIFDVHRKIGEGTFSSVYLGSLHQHRGLPDSEKRWFAIKHLVPTSHPARIEHELRCLQDIGGKNHVIGVELCLRHLDTVVFVMPYIPHKKFSEYVGEMDAEELRKYMRALLTALKHVHSFGVIHRDVKPSNFLYDRENQRYLLVDFGLAQRMVPPPAEPRPLAPPPPAHASSNRKRLLLIEQDESSPEVKRAALDLSTGGGAAPAPTPAPAPAPAPASAPAPGSNTPLPKSAAGTAGAGACGCAGAAGVCSACAARPQARAPRAGTQGFRPPEVLLKCPQQSTAVDVWAAGVVLASALAARYPLLRAADDGAALAELADLLGTAPLRRAAAGLGACAHTARTTHYTLHTHYTHYTHYRRRRRAGRAGRPAGHGAAAARRRRARAAPRDVDEPPRAVPAQAVRAPARRPAPGPRPGPRGPRPGPRGPRGRRARAAPALRALPHAARQLPLPRPLCPGAGDPRGRARGRLPGLGLRARRRPAAARARRAALGRRRAAPPLHRGRRLTAHRTPHTSHRTPHTARDTSDTVRNPDVFNSISTVEVIHFNHPFYRW